MNTIRELKQQEKYKSMLKRKNKEKKIYKDKNASLQLEKQRLYIALRNKDKEIERLKNIIKEVREYITYARTSRTIYEIGYGKGTCVKICMEHLLEILDKGEIK